MCKAFALNYNMEQWTTALFIFYINWQLIFQASQATEELNYPVCVELNTDLVAKAASKEELPYVNSATRCASRCKEQRYTFSGTKSTWCYCGGGSSQGLSVSTKCDTKCPGDATETCGGEDSVSIRQTGYIEGKTVTIRPTRTATPLPEDTVSTIDSAPETASQKDTKGSPSTGSQMTALYITLPVVIIVASSVAIIVWLILRHKRQVGETRDKRDEVASCYFTQEVGRNSKSDAYHIYDTICPNAIEYDGDSTQQNKAGKTYATDYLKPKNANGTADDPKDSNEYLTPEDPKDSNEYLTPEDPKDNNEYLTPEDPKDSNEYLTPEDPKDNNEYLTPEDPKDSHEYLTPEDPKDSNEYLTPLDPNYSDGYVIPVDPNYSDGYVIPVDSNSTAEYSVESKLYYDDIY